MPNLFAPVITLPVLSNMSDKHPLFVVSRHVTYTAEVQRRCIYQVVGCSKLPPYNHLNLLDQLMDLSRWRSLSSSTAIIHYSHH